MSRKAATKPPLTAMHMAIAACSIELTGGNEIQLLPAGKFSGMDGRPKDAPCWYLDAALAQRLIEKANSRVNDFVIDYEHQTLLAQKNGQPAPAAGWFKKLEWREGDGLYAVDVRWTDRAQSMIAAKEYKYVSPVIFYSTTGDVTGLYMAAVTNNPNIDGMEETLLAAASQYFASLTSENQMDELLEQLRWLLNLPVGATAEDVLAQLQKLIDQIKQASPESTAAASFDLAAHLEAQRNQIASLSAATPDPAKYVAIGTMTELQAQVAQLSAELTTTRVDSVVKKALDEGKLLPAMEQWARDYGAKDLAALSAYLDHAPPIGILSGTQTGGNPPVGTETGGSLTEDQIAMCTAMGIDQEAFLKTLKAEKQG